MDHSKKNSSVHLNSSEVAFVRYVLLDYMSELRRSSSRYEKLVCRDLIDRLGSLEVSENYSLNVIK